MNKFLDIVFHNKTVRDGSVFAFFTFLNRGLNFILLIILSWYILPSSYGKLNLFYTALSIVSFVICLCTSGIVSIKYFKVTRKVLSQFINIVLIITFIDTILLLLCISIFHEFINRITGITPMLQMICIYLCATAVVYNLLLDIYRLEEKSIRYGIITTVSTIINICASLLLVIVFKQDWYGRLEANIVASTAFLFLALFLLIKKKYLVKIKPTKEQYKETLIYGIPLIPHSCNGFLRQGMDRYIINAHFNPASVGLFSFAINFSFLIYTIGSAFNQSNSVYIYKTLSNGGDEIKDKLRRQTIIMLAFYFFITTLLVLGCWLLIPIIFPNYKDSIIYVFPLCLGCFFQCVYLQFCNILFYYKKTRQLMCITVSVSLIHLILSLMLTKYSVLYTAYISAFTSCVEAMLVYWYSRVYFRFI